MDGLAEFADQPMPYWDDNHFDLNDRINENIWKDSPAIQQLIRPPRRLGDIGAFGAQQAMLEPRARSVWRPHLTRPGILPWVPDLAGKRWKKRDAVFVVGSAYAGFIKEYSGRRAAMNLCCYASAASARQFQERFLREVVQPDTDYYSKLELLFARHRRAAQLCLMDLCRASFVERGTRAGRKQMDKSNEPSREPAWGHFRLYAEHPACRGWTQRRLTESRTTKIVALGWIAEHGVLQLLRDWFGLNRGFTIVDTNGEPLVLAQDWTPTYASRRRLNHWLKSGAWWNVAGQVDGEPRKWQVLPVYHPSAMQRNDPRYARTRGRLAAFLAAP